MISFIPFVFSISNTDIEGCTNYQACNFNEIATNDDGSCQYESDCLGECGGSAEVDDCGVCEGGNVDMDCAGVCYGSASFDQCQDPICTGGETGLIPNESCSD